MDYNKSEIKEIVVKLYMEGNNISKISKMTGYSREHIGKILKADSRVQEYRNKKIVNLQKNPSKSVISTFISMDFWQKIGVSKDVNVKEKVEIFVDENAKTITIKKI